MHVCIINYTWNLPGRPLRFSIYLNIYVVWQAAPVTVVLGSAYGTGFGLQDLLGFWFGSGLFLTLPGVRGGTGVRVGDFASPMGQAPCGGRRVTVL